MVTLPTYISEGSYTLSYMDLLQKLLYEGNEKAPRGEKVKFFQNCLFNVELPGTIFSPASRPYNADYLNKELNLYFSGECSAEKFGEASKFWKKLANPDGTINSNYGYLIFHKPIENKFGIIKNQWTYAKTQLMNDKDTRQALMFVSSPHVQFDGNKDFICTLNYTFSINDDWLSLTVNRRSQDMILGIVYDYAWEWLLLLKMYNELKDVYPSLRLGSYTMFCNNIHLYERNWDMAKKIVMDYKSGAYDDLKINDIVDPAIMQNFVLNKEFGN